MSPKDKIFSALLTITCILGIIACLAIAQGCSKKNHPKTSALNEERATQFI